MGDTTSADVDDLAARLRDARQIVVLTGAGISTESGIPDFRGPQGVWTKDPAAERKANIEHYVADPEHRRAVWRDRARGDQYRREPNDGHRALVTLEQKTNLHTLVTQNVDGLHQDAGTSPEIVIEIHGTLRSVKCLACGWRGPMAETLDRVRAGEDDPTCLRCGGMLKSATVSFGEQLVTADLVRAQQAAAGSDVFLAVGTSLGVYPAAGLPEMALRRGAFLAVLNGEPTPFDSTAGFVGRERLGTLLPDLASRL
jgi:NAD-dependent deacetylase